MKVLKINYNYFWMIFKKTYSNIRLKIKLIILKILKDFNNQKKIWNNQYKNPICL